MVEASSNDVERLFKSGATICVTNIHMADPNLARWAQTIAENTSRCGEVYVYFKHEEEGKGPEFARMLMEQLRVT